MRTCPGFPHGKLSRADHHMNKSRCRTAMEYVPFYIREKEKIRILHIQVYLPKQALKEVQWEPSEDGGGSEMDGDGPRNFTQYLLQPF